MVYGNFSQIFHIVEKILRETPKGKTTLVSTRSMGSFFFFNLCLIFYITNDKCELFFFSQHMHKYTFFFFKTRWYRFISTGLQKYIRSYEISVESLTWKYICRAFYGCRVLALGEPVKMPYWSYKMTCCSTSFYLCSSTFILIIIYPAKYHLLNPFISFFGSLFIPSWFYIILFL